MRGLRAAAVAVREPALGADRTQRTSTRLPALPRCARSVEFVEVPSGSVEARFAATIEAMSERGAP